MTQTAPQQWPSETVTKLLAADQRLQWVPGDLVYAHSQLEQIADGECYHALVAGGRGDWNKANTETYAAARKAVEMLLFAASWRVGAAGGGHQAVVSVV